MLDYGISYQGSLFINDQSQWAFEGYFIFNENIELRNMYHIILFMFGVTSRLDRKPPEILLSLDSGQSWSVHSRVFHGVTRVLVVIISEVCWSRESAC